MSQTFDKVKLYGLFIKLIKRNILRFILDLLIYWLPRCYISIKWNGICSKIFGLTVGVRQGSVLAPLLFSIYVNDSSSACNQSYLGEILLYADDILILARSLVGLQRLFDFVQAELSWLDLRLNYDKSVSMRLGPRFDHACLAITTADGNSLKCMG
jgi:Reverse transcriptase (RNA-dependent DNA polymerase)